MIGSEIINNISPSFKCFTIFRRVARQTETRLSGALLMPPCTPSTIPLALRSQTIGTKLKHCWKDNLLVTSNSYIRMIVAGIVK